MKKKKKKNIVKNKIVWLTSHVRDKVAKKGQQEEDYMPEVTVIPYGTRQYVNVLPSDNDLYCPTHLIMFCCNFHTK